MQTGQVVSVSPSFNSYSNCKLVEIASRVVEEFGGEEFYEEFYQKREGILLGSEDGNDDEEDSKNVEKSETDDDEDFEFAIVAGDSQFSSPADEIFSNGQILPVFPIMNRDSLIRNENGSADSSSKEPIRLPLGKFFAESETSDEDGEEDLDGVPSETYCMWRPKLSEAAAEARCKKSSSTGSTAKRCTFKDLLHRSHSDGDQDTLVFVIPSKQRANEKNRNGAESPVAGRGKMKVAVQYARNGGDRRRSYLPYRKNLVWFFANVNAFSRPS